MRLVVIRHAIAEAREQFAVSGQEDELRPLTEEGRRKMREAAKGLHRIVGQIDLLATSPLIRAAQTAAIVAAEYDDIRVVTESALEPEGMLGALLSWLRAQENAEVIAIVGHEPHLGVLVTWLLTGVASPRLPMRKGGACLLEFGRRPAKGEATLHWALTPSLLRRIAG